MAYVLRLIWNARIIIPAFVRGIGSIIDHLLRFSCYLILIPAPGTLSMTDADMHAHAGRGPARGAAGGGATGGGGTRRGAGGAAGGGGAGRRAGGAAPVALRGRVLGRAAAAAGDDVRWPALPPGRRGRLHGDGPHARRRRHGQGGLARDHPQTGIVYGDHACMDAFSVCLSVLRFSLIFSRNPCIACSSQT